MPEKDMLEDLLLPVVEPKEPEFDPKEVTELKAQLADSEKAQQGLLKNVQEERRKRQELKGQLSQVTTTVNSMLEQRETLVAQSQTEKDEATLDGIQVEFTEAGDAFLPREKLSEFTSPHEEKISTLEDELKATREAQALQLEYQQNVDAMVGAKPEYAEAHRQYQSARKWISDVVADWSYNHNVTQAMNSGDALTHVINEDVTNEFKTRFPELDIVTITTAEDSSWHFNNMLEKTSQALNSVEATPKDSRFQKVLNKPSSLGKSADAKGGEVSLAEKVGSLSATDILSFDDNQIEALSNHLKTDEEKDGINW